MKRVKKPTPKSYLPADPVDNPIPGVDATPDVWAEFWRTSKAQRIDTYLAGGRSVINGRNWRQYLEERLPINAIDPFRDSEQECLFQFVSQDIDHVRRSNLVIACYFGGYASHGMAAEMGIAVERSIPLFYVDESEQPDMFLVGLAKRYFPTIESLCQWWARRVANGIAVP